jgi:hypothetical protein
MNPDKTKENDSHPNQFIFFVGEKINVNQTLLTGAQIKDAVRNVGKTIDPTHSLILEGHGDEADRTIGDNESVDIMHGCEEKGPKHFHCRPNADFGFELPSGSSIEKHFTRLTTRYPNASIQAIPGTQTYSVHISEIDLPAGWNKSKTSIWFIVPAGYPSSTPDCFWSEDLRTMGGVEPKSSNTGTIHPFAAAGSRWYSWHVKAWSPITGDLLSYVSTIRDRLGRVE